MPNPQHQSAHLFGLQIDALTFGQAVALLSEQVPNRPAKVVVTPNVDHVLSLDENPALRDFYNSADFKFQTS